MLFFTPVISVIFIYGAAALLPAILLLRYIYNKDTIEKEPSYLLKKLLVGGVLAAFLAIALETVGMIFLDVTVSADSNWYYIIMAFLVVAVAEEGAKLLFLKQRSWNDPNFDYHFDGVVYAVFVSLGFAAFENVKYVIEYGLSVALPRGILAVPGHMGFAVFMGIFYAQARHCANRGNTFGVRLNLLLGFLSAVFLHGFYDACAMIGSSLTAVLFILFVVSMYIIVYNLIRRASLQDHPI